MSYSFFGVCVEVVIILYVRIFVVDPVVKFSLSFSNFFFLFEVFLVLVC